MTVYDDHQPAPGEPPPAIRPQRRAYYSISDYPRLAEVQARWPEILVEAKLALATLGERLGDQIGPSWILPLIPEAEDEHVFTEEVCRTARELAPLTCRLVQSLPYIKAFAFSKLAAGRHIPMHEHWNPFLTSMLCLQDGGNSRIVVNGERHDFVTGGLLLFDYTLPHEVINDGSDDRIVLLMLIDRRKKDA